MDSRTLRRIDFWIGVPACFLLTLIAGIFRILMRRNRVTRPPEGILFIKLVEQGATVLALPAIARAQEAAGRSNVYFLTLEGNEGIIHAVDALPTENVLRLRQNNLFAFAIDAIRTLWWIRRSRIDCTIDLEGFARGPALVAYLTGARIRVGLHRFTGSGPYRGNLMTHRVQYNPHIHVSKYYLGLVEAAFQTATDEPHPKVALPRIDCEQIPRFTPAPDETLRVRQLLEQILPGANALELVVLNAKPVDVLPWRQWPMESYRQLVAQMLASRRDVAVVLTGLDEDVAALDRLSRELNSPRVVNLAGRLNMRELLCLFTLARVLISSDSGPAHFASLTRTPTVVLFGPETPALYGPIGPRVDVVYLALACSPCFNALNERTSVCRNNVCMSRIAVDDVLNRVLAKLSAPLSAGTPQ